MPQTIYMPPDQRWQAAQGAIGKASDFLYDLIRMETMNDYRQENLETQYKQQEEMISKRIEADVAAEKRSSLAGYEVVQKGDRYFLETESVGGKRDVKPLTPKSTTTKDTWTQLKPTVVNGTTVYPQISNRGELKFNKVAPKAKDPAANRDPRVALQSLSKEYKTPDSFTERIVLGGKEKVQNLSNWLTFAHKADTKGEFDRTLLFNETLAVMADLGYPQEIVSNFALMMDDPKISFRIWDIF